MLKNKRIYIAGPMRGYKYYNFPAFDAAKRKLEAEGYVVVSPADLDRERGDDPFDPIQFPEDYDWSLCPDSFDLQAAVLQDVEAIISCDAIYMLNNWKFSRGATAEFCVAVWLGKQVLFETPRNVDVQQIVRDLAVERAFELQRYSKPDNKQPEVKEDILEEALRITGGDRQATYGPPDQDFQRVADMWSGYLRYQLAGGFKFEPFHIASMMIILKQSRQMHQRKRDNWTDTAGYARCGQLCDEAATTRDND